MLLYLIKSTACLTIFFIFYKMLLEKENMHHFKRAYLLGALTLSLVIPNLVFTEYVVIYPEVSTLETPINYSPSEFNEPQPISIEEEIDWSIILWGIYWIGVCGFGIRFLRNLSQIFWRIYKNPKLKSFFTTKVLLTQALPPHTFFSYIFLNKKQYEAQSIAKEVLLHEETHAKQYHSLDVLLVEMAQVFLWFNPLIYLLKSSIKLNHEFLADQSVIKTQTSISRYQNLLLSFLTNGSDNNNQSIKIANAIVYSSTRAERSRSIKKRFTVMKTKTSKKSMILRSSLLFPLITLMLFGFSEKRQIEKEKAYEQIIEMEIIDNESLQLENKTYPINDFSKALQEVYLKTVKAENTKIEIEVNYPIHYNIIQKVTAEIKKANVHLIHITATEVIMNNSQYVDKVPITPESIILKTKKMTLVDNSGSGKISQSDLKAYNTLAKQYNAIPIEERKIPLKDLQVLETIYRKMSNAEKESAQPFPECLLKTYSTNQNTIKQIYVNINNKGQLLVQEDLVALGDLSKFLSKINPHLSVEQRRKIVASKIYVDSKAPEEVVQEVERILTEYGVATINIVGPKDKQFSRVQQSATREEMKEYNALAKKYNEMDRNHMVIKSMEVRRLEEVYAKMSKKQQADAEPFPDFPKPPPAPEAPKPPKNVSDTEYASNQIKKTIDTQDPYDVVGGPLTINTPQPPSPPNPVEHMEELAKEGAEFMLNGTPISAEKALEIVKSNKKINIDLRESSGEKTLVKLSVDPIQIKN